MQIAIEEFVIREPVGGDVFGAAATNVLPVHGTFASAAFATESGVWAVLIGADSDGTKGRVANAFAAFAKTLAEKRNVTCAAVNAEVPGNEELVQRLLEPTGTIRVPRVMLLAPGTGDRLADSVEVDVEPRASLPLRISRAAVSMERSLALINDAGGELITLVVDGGNSHAGLRAAVRRFVTL